MAEPSKAVYTELKIRPNVTEAISVANVVFDSKRGTVEILGLPHGLNKENIVTFSEKAYTDVETVVDPAELERILARNPKVAIDTIESGIFHGRLLSNHGGNEVALIDDGGGVTMLPNIRAIKNIKLEEKLSADPLLKIAYSREKTDREEAKVSIMHLLNGLSFGGIVYEFDFGSKKLGISPFVYVTNKSPLDFENVKVTLVMLEKPMPEGERIRPEINPLEQYLKRSEDIGVRRQVIKGALDKTVLFARRAAVAEEGEERLECLSMNLAEEITTEETIEGSVAAVDTEGKYSLSQGENKRARLNGIVIDNYHHANVLLINPNKYEQSGIYHTSIIDAIRFIPNSDLKAGSFYFDGQQLEFPAMKKDQEYELGLRTCRNLEAQLSKEKTTKTDERERQIITTNYDVKLINNTGDEQKVEVNMPVEVINKMGTFAQVGFEYGQKTIAGEEYYVANVTVKAKSTAEFKFSLETK